MEKGGLLGKLLLPGYTDAGASTTFNAENGEEENRPEGSEAATEIRDNRTSVKREFRANHSNKTHLPLHQDQESTTTTDPSMSSIATSRPPQLSRDTSTTAVVGFFPTTKPLASPKPDSPPEVTRQTVALASNATKAESVFTQTGKENQRRFQFWEGDSGEGSVTESELPGSVEHLPLNAANLERKAAADLPDSNDHSFSSTASSNPPNRDRSLLQDDDAGSEVASDVLSTASEMGTVIEIGNHAARMAEIDAMAALIEASPNVDHLTPRPDSFPRAPSQTPQRRTAPPAPDLALPVLDSQSGPSDLQPSHSSIHRPNQQATASAMLTTAIRRIGSGLHKTKTSLSAPPTPKTPGAPPPPRIDELLKSTLTPRNKNSENGRHQPRIDEHQELPPSLALRSPGSAARISLRAQQDRPTAILAPRFTQRSDAIHRSFSLDYPSSTMYLDKSNPAMSPFRFAQKCFSFDSTLDDEAGSATSSQLLKLESFPSQRTKYQHSPKPDSEGAFRAHPHRSLHIGGLRQTESQEVFEAQRARVHSVDSPTKLAGLAPPTMELKTPQRVVDIEREDALDILACLVERGVAAWDEDDGQPGPNSTTQQPSTASLDDSLESAVATLTQELRSSVDQAESTEDRNKQIEALEELVKSHSYALEMKRAALSASSWLRSIGVQHSSLSHRRTSPSESKPLPIMPEVGEEARRLDLPVESDPDYKMELMTLKARFRSMEQELREKNEVAARLDKELSECRAEIGRLQTATRTEQSTVQNRSILDDDAGDSIPSSPVDQSAGKKQDPPSPIATRDSDAEEEDKLFDESFQGNNSLFQDVSMFEAKNRSAEAERIDVLVLQSALDQANEQIRVLHERLQKDKGEEMVDAPTISVPDTSLNSKESSIPPPSPSSDEHRTVNVRMLDGENFVTEWDELRPSLPPPPDHGLRSPIVHTVMEQWTTDRGLHESLLAWMERVMTSDNLENSVPPLTISSLDHQVRDGFVMHVLPLLLRRADIHVGVQTRAHRRTLYDLAVTVSQKGNSVVDGQGASLLDQHVDEDSMDKDGTQSSVAGTTYSAVTELAANGTNRNSGRGIKQPDDETEYSHFGIPNVGSADMDDLHQPSLMGALGGALAGFLSRGKHASLATPPRSGNASGIPSSGSFSLERPLAEMDNQPYHRVVSAPPGRIGVTFVEIRGHAIVSDVAPDSPLSSWVFPSDILIAVDEVPVSGMRVRDIIRVLTNRKDRQRALRVISSHAMNEFTLNQSGIEETP